MRQMPAFRHIKSIIFWTLTVICWWLVPYRMAYMCWIRMGTSSITSTSSPGFSTILSSPSFKTGNAISGFGTDDGISHINIHDPIVFHRDFTGQMGTPYAAMLAQDQLYVGTNQGLFCKHWKASFSDESPFELIPGTQGQVWFFTAY